MTDERARALRKDLTRHEARLWLRLRTLRPQGIHIRRQVPMNGYILDFACLRAKLAIEVDGEHHGIGRQQAHDVLRDAALARAGLRVLRFWNHEIDANIDGVVETIIAAAEQGLKARRSSDLR
ncbi:endonuclease domain-containing protein [Lichenibacterium dinghuense]|uniref:endonuclease domain-containing protein n=1 Tax=Lichenibacterium dinghuense TaxID=2895977 RepID=UPI001F26A96D|nr:DUF559 domain-containing protein [Lichenibacterium sp. 6Y81]